MKCTECNTELDLDEIGGRCPNCHTSLEIYYDPAEAQRAAALYNDGESPPERKARVRVFEDAEGWVVFFPSLERLTDVAGRILWGRSA
ncbi:MAG TPA: hypothetical protein VGM03_19350 [Phycisphaerae bacterium]